MHDVFLLNSNTIICLFREIRLLYQQNSGVIGLFVDTKFSFRVTLQLQARWAAELATYIPFRPSLNSFRRPLF